MKLMFCALVREKKLNYRIVYATRRNDGAMFQSKINSNKTTPIQEEHEMPTHKQGTLAHK